MASKFAQIIGVSTAKQNKPILLARTDSEGLLRFPVGSALIKTFKLEGRLIETRVLLHRPEGWVALPYQWNAEQTDAKLVLAGARSGDSLRA